MPKTSLRNLGFRASLAARVYAVAMQETETFTDNDIGLDLAYLLGAIVTGGQVDWRSPHIIKRRGGLYSILKTNFKPSHTVWKSIML